MTSLEQFDDWCEMIEAIISVKYEHPLILEMQSEDKKSFELMNESIMPVVECFFPLLPDRLLDLIALAIKWHWGEDAYFEVNETAIIFKHKDGRKLEYFILF